jgi:hypothetical protein
MQRYKPIVQASPTYIRNTEQCQNDLITLTRLPYNARIFTADAVCMYSNIDLDTGIAAVQQWLEEETELTQECIDLVIALLQVAHTGFKSLEQQCAPPAQSYSPSYASPQQNTTFSTNMPTASHTSNDTSMIFSASG